MAMGIASAPDTFQSIMNEILSDLPYVLIYIDDVLCLQEEGESADSTILKYNTIQKTNIVSHSHMKTKIVSNAPQNH